MIKIIVTFKVFIFKMSLLIFFQVSWSGLKNIKYSKKNVYVMFKSGAEQIVGFSLVLKHLIYNILSI